MRAIVVHEFGGPEVLKIEEVPAPAPAAGQVLIRVKAIGVNPVDTYIRTGSYAKKPALPYIPHADIAGTIEALGAGVSGFASGDRVYAYGADSGGAELAAVPAAQVRRLPASVTFAQGAAVGVPYTTAWRALERAQPVRGETVLIHGASGAVGIAAMQMARARGLAVIGTAGTPEGLALVQQYGTPLPHPGPGYNEKVLAATGGRGPNIILEMLANVNLDRDLELLAVRGRVEIIGNRGTIEINPRKAMAKDATIHAMTLMNATPEELAQINDHIAAGLADGSLQPVICKELPLEQVAQAHIEVLQTKAPGKIVLLP